MKKKRERILKLLLLKHTNQPVKEVPNHIIEFYKPVDYRVLIRPLVIDDYVNGYSISRLIVKYEETWSAINNIIEQYKKSTA